MVHRNEPVHNKTCTRLGYTTGGVRPCTLEGCTGLRIGVRWSDHTLTWPCTAGMEQRAGAWYIRDTTERDETKRNGTEPTT